MTTNRFRASYRPLETCHVRETPVDEVLSQPLRVYVHEHTIGCLALAAVARHRVGMVQMGCASIANAILRPESSLTCR